MIKFTQSAHFFAEQRLTVAVQVVWYFFKIPTTFRKVASVTLRPRTVSNCVNFLYA